MAVALFLAVLCSSSSCGETSGRHRTHGHCVAFICLGRRVGMRHPRGHHKGCGGPRPFLQEHLHRLGVQPGKQARHQNVRGLAASARLSGCAKPCAQPWDVHPAAALVVVVGVAERAARRLRGHVSEGRHRAPAPDARVATHLARARPCADASAGAASRGSSSIRRAMVVARCAFAQSRVHPHKTTGKRRINRKPRSQGEDFFQKRLKYSCLRGRVV